MPGDRRPEDEAVFLDRMILRSIVDHAVITLDADCRVTSWNEGAENILGWTEEEAIGQSGDIFFTPEDVARNRPETEMRTALAEGRAEDERWHMRKDGSRFWASGLMMPLLAGADGADRPRATGTEAGFVKVFRDRTFHKKARNRIASLEQRVSLTMKRVGTVGIFEIDVASRTIVADEIAARLHGMPWIETSNGVSLLTFFDHIHPDDLPLARAALERSLRDGVDFDAVYRTAADVPRPGWLHAQATVQASEVDGVVRLSGIVVDITDQRDTATMQDMQLAFLDRVGTLGTAEEIAELAARTLAEALHASRAGYGHLGKDGDSFRVQAEWSADGGAGLAARDGWTGFDRFLPRLKVGETVVVRDTRDDAAVADAGDLAEAGIRSLGMMPSMQRGRVRAVLFVNDTRPRTWSRAELVFMRAILDRTYSAIDRVRFDNERNLMAAELAHRMKNVLTIAQVIVTQTLRGTDDIATARAAIADRLHALSEAQDVLTAVNNRKVAIRDVVASALRPYLGDGERISFSGPRMLLNAQQVLGLALGLHELATNATKYGALSNDTGRVEIAWTVTDDTLTFTWSETGGPPVGEVTPRGFGSKILNQVVGGYFGGTTRLSYDPEGLRFVLTGRS